VGVSEVRGVKSVHLKHDLKAPSYMQGDADWLRVAKRVTLCWSIFLEHVKWTEDLGEVTCKRCLRMLKRRRA